MFLLTKENDKLFAFNLKTHTLTSLIVKAVSVLDKNVNIVCSTVDEFGFEVEKNSNTDIIKYHGEYYLVARDLQNIRQYFTNQINGFENSLMIPE